MGEGIKDIDFQYIKKCHRDVMYTMVIKVNTPLHILKVSKRVDLESYQKKIFCSYVS